MLIQTRPYEIKAIGLVAFKNWLHAHTAQLCVFDNRLARAWMQQATSARGLVAETAEIIAGKEKMNKLIDKCSIPELTE